MQKKQKTKKVFLWLGITCIALISCEYPDNEKIKEELNNCKINLDIRNQELMDCYSNYYALVKTIKDIDSLKLLALKEVDEYRNAAIYQVETMRANMFKQFEKIESKGNVIIKADSARKIKSLGFDSTGKPQIIFK